MEAYPNLFSPIQIGRNLLHSRFNASVCHPHFAQGPEPYPSENLFRHYINKARQGCGYVIVSGNMVPGPPMRTRGHIPGTMVGHFPNYDVADSTVQHYMAQLADALHFYDTKAAFMVGTNGVEGYDVDDGILPFVVAGDGGGAGFLNKPGKRLNEKQIMNIIDEITEQAVLVQDCGFDMVYMHSAYRLMITGRFLSPRTNHRDDEFGGSIENRCRFHKLLCESIKKRCGKDFLISFSFTGEDLEEKDPALNWTLDDTRELVKQLDGYCDILQVRPFSVEYVHNMGYELNPTPCLHAAAAAKEASKNIAITCVSGFWDPDLAEAAIRDGKVDMIDMGRSFISNPDWGKLARAGRRDDIVPCIKCNKCHRNTYQEPPLAVCSVNPTWSQEQRIDFLVRPAEKQLNLAVVGGGAAGMRAALFAADRGHKITLFEKSGCLGGRLNINQYCDFKWPVKDYTDWLVRHTLDNPSIDVRLNTEATKELLDAGNYDEIIAAVGADSVFPPIPGIKGENVFAAPDVYGHEDICGENVVIIGGGDIGVETGLHLTRKGKKVFVIEMLDELMKWATPIHYRVRVEDEWKKTEAFSYACNAVCTKIDEKGVYYKDENGAEQFVPADTVLISAGLRAKRDVALGLYSFGRRIHLIGDCNKPGSVQTCNRDAYRTASTL